MKKFAIAAITAVVATVSLSSVAEAHRRHHWDDSWGWDGPVDVVVYRPHCSTIKIFKETDWGTKVFVIRKCR